MGENEPTDSALRRFRKGVLSSGILPEARRPRGQSGAEPGSAVAAARPRVMA